ncbi:hypothetical protein [Asticcacaulis biprosthecium]|uniref:hypothetical protein n=1 Tax=Asticcacaulis biprosthecium TaxID=76891 RepID=UPI00059009FE|nr:hypothetical protein [Asticcacaulis biprosthecium]
MRRLTKDEIASYRLRLGSWLPLDDVDAIMAEVGDQTQMFAVAQGGLKFWRETWIAMSCAQLMHARRLKLGDDPPDFWLDFGRQQQAFEIVQVMPRDYRPGVIYGQYAADLTSKGSTELVERSFDQVGIDLENLPNDLAAQLRAKCAKKYDSDLILIVDLLHDVILEADSGVVLGMVRVTRPALNTFREVWLRRGNAIVRVTEESVSLVTNPLPG